MANRQILGFLRYLLWADVANPIKGRRRVGTDRRAVPTTQRIRSGSSSLGATVKAVSFLLQTAELQTRDRKYRRYSRGRATTSAVLAMCWY
jgi:hypothetical protein